MTMPITFTCPSCAKPLKASAERVGRQAKCPSCGGSITIPPRTDGTAGGAGNPAVRMPPLAAKTPHRDPAVKTRQPRKYSRSQIVAAAFVALVAGYFAGSFHPLEKMLASFEKARKIITGGFDVQPQGSPVAGDPPPTFGDEAAYPAESWDQMLVSRGSSLAIGDEYTAEGFAVALTEVSISRSGIDSKNSEGIFQPEELSLLCTFRLTNTDNQKTLRFLASGENKGVPFTVIDDDGHVVRRFSSGIPSVAGTSSGFDEIPPGEQRTHVESFQLSNPDVEHLILIVNLKAFGGDGRIGFRIPTDRIDGVPPDES